MLKLGHNRVDDGALDNYGLILLIGQALIPITAAIGLILAVVGTVFSAVSKKQGDIGAGKLIAADIIIILLAGAVAAYTFWVFFVIGSVTLFSP